MPGCEMLSRGCLLFSDHLPVKIPNPFKRKMYCVFFLVCLHIHDHAYQGTCVDVKGQLVSFIHNVGLGQQTQVSVA